MSTSEARRRANQANAMKSTGPKTQEGKEISRQNAYKHGMTGTGVVIAIEDSAEMERRTVAFRNELNPSGDIGQALVRRAAFLSVQIDRSMVRAHDAVAERVRKVEAEFQAPEGVGPAEAAHLKAIARREATFDDSPAAALARKYENAAERGFYRALRELRQVERAVAALAPPGSAATFDQLVGSFMQHDAEFDDWAAKMENSLGLPPSMGRNRAEMDERTPRIPGNILPVTVGQRP